MGRQMGQAGAGIDRSALLHLRDLKLRRAECRQFFIHFSSTFRQDFIEFPSFFIIFAQIYAALNAARMLLLQNMRDKERERERERERES